MPEMENMEKRIELEKRGRKSEEITELNLDNCRSTQIHGLTEAFENLEILSLINVGLTSLKGFPCLPNLRKLELSDNRLASGLDHVGGCPNLNYLNLSGNKFKDIECLEPLKSLEKLRHLDLFNCEVTNLENYRVKVFETLPFLTFLNGFDKNDVEADDDEEDGDPSGDEENGLDEDDLSEDEDEDVSSENVGLSYLQKSGLEEESEGEDFEPGEDDDEEDGSDEDGEEEGDDSLNTSGQVLEGGRGVKRKHSEEETK